MHWKYGLKSGNSKKKSLCSQALQIHKVVLYFFTVKLFKVIPSSTGMLDLDPWNKLPLIIACWP